MAIVEERLNEMRLAKAAMTTGDLASTTECTCGSKDGSHKRGCPCRLAKRRHDVPNIPGKSNWVERAGGLPPAIRDMAGAILDDPKSGIKDVDRAIATAVSQAKKLAAKGNAKYVRAVAQWEKMRAKS